MATCCEVRNNCNRPIPRMSDEFRRCCGERNYHENWLARSHPMTKLRSTYVCFPLAPQHVKCVLIHARTHTTYQRQACVAKGLSTQGGNLQPQLWSSLSEPTWAREMRWLWVDTAQSPETLAKDLCAKTCRLVPQAPMTSLANMESIINQHNQGLERSA